MRPKVLNWFSGRSRYLIATSKHIAQSFKLFKHSPRKLCCLSNTMLLIKTFSSQQAGNEALNPLGTWTRPQFFNTRN